MRRRASPAQGREMHTVSASVRISRSDQGSKVHAGREKQTTKDRKVHEGGLPARNQRRNGELNESHSWVAPGSLPNYQTDPCAKIFPHADQERHSARSAKRLRISHLRLSYRIKFLSPVFPLRYAGSRLTICIVPQHPAVQ